VKNGFGMNVILGEIHTYPTLAELNKFAAGNWKKNNVSEKTLAWGERINRWQSGEGTISNNFTFYFDTVN
jgi:hypothetical protein